jgi:hypothetical protein
VGSSPASILTLTTCRRPWWAWWLIGWARWLHGQIGGLVDRLEK